MSITQTEARSRIKELIQRYHALSNPERKQRTETDVIHQFVRPLFEALGWPTHDPQRFHYELHTQVGRPDMTLTPEQGGALFVEAKRFGVIAELAEARRTIEGIIKPGQLALPGMAADRTREEQQAINYAFQNGGAWAILTNFEKLRLFNARRDWLVLSFERPGAYLDEFDLLWQLAYAQIGNGGLEALSNQRHREDVDTNYLDFINTYRERLAQDILAHRAENPWAWGADGNIRVADLRAVVQRLLDRLVVLRFAEDHQVVPAGTLQQLYELRQSNPYTFPLYQHFAQLFRVFDQKHNSALFAPDLADRAVVSDAVLLPLTAKLYEARYRALSADIIGNTYEQYLGKTLVQVGQTVLTRDNLETRKKQGSYYTPQVIVRYLVDHALGRYLYGTRNGQPDGAPLPDETGKTAAEIRQVRVIDPACGSGSFLIYAYQVLADFYRREIRRLEEERQTRLQALMQTGKTTPFELQVELASWTAELDRLQNYPRYILEHHLYGVDLDPQAAEIATVNLIMRALADQPQSERRLPLILNQNVKVGNALIGAGPSDPRYANLTAELAELRHLRLALVREGDGDQHASLLRQIEELSARLNAILNADLAGHFADPAAHRPFHWVVEFPEVFADEAAPGFDVVIGNPPWEILKPDLREYYAQFDARIESKLTRSQVETRISELATDPALAAGWQAQTARIEAEAAWFSRAGEYTRQGKGDRATHKLFVERGYQLLQPQGRLGLVIPSGIYTDLGTKELREMLLNEGRINYLFSFSNERYFFPHIHHAFKFVLIGAQKGIAGDKFSACFRINPRVAINPSEFPDFLANLDNLVRIDLAMLKKFNPGSLSVMEFLTQQAYEVTARIYAEWPRLSEELDNIWNLDLVQEIHSTNGRALFNEEKRGFPLYEGKHIHQYNAYYAEPRFFIEENLGRQYIIGKKDVDQGVRLAYQDYRLAHRRITGAVNERSMIACVIPPNSFCSDVAQTVRVIYPYSLTLYLVGVFNSFVIDFILRQKITNHIDMHFVYSLPIPRLTAGNPFFDAIVPRAARLTCTRSEFADLWQAVIGEPWTPDSGATDPAQRQQLRAELDALVAHLYGLSRADFAHILTTFPLVFPNDTPGQAKQATLLAVYDRMAQAGI